MKKTLIGLAVFAMSIIPAVAVAQNQSSDNSVKVENVANSKGDKSKKDKKDKKDRKDKDGKKARDGKKGDCKKADCKKGAKDFTARKGDMKGGKMKGGMKQGRVYNDSVNLASLNLNESQKTQIKALNEARKASARELRENARQARVAGDSSFVFDGTQIEMVQSKYLKDLRAVLTADQYVQFLENNYVKAGMGQKGNRPDMRKGDRKGGDNRQARMMNSSKKDLRSAKVETKSAKMAEKQTASK